MLKMQDLNINKEYIIYKMLKNKIYTCEICKTKPDQLSHHKTHLQSQKHKYKKELFELKLSNVSSKELQKLYNTSDLSIIIDENETNTYIPIEDNKKLINSNSDNEYNDIHNKKMLDNEKIEQSNNVSNKEALKDKIHEIHNYLRNNGAGYGMNALKVFNLLYGLKKIEEKNLLDKVNLKRPDCEFSHLLKMANDGKLREKLSVLIFGDVLSSIKESDIGDLLFYEIPQNIKSSVFTYLINEIDKITVIEKTCNVLLSGKIYEYFIGRDESAISELGAYFTDRHIVEYIYNKLDPKINKDGSINSMIDMFGGSGGFTTGYINYLNNKYDNIEWENNINKIYHYDMNDDVVKSAGLELFCLTGLLPNIDNLGYKNSFTDSFNNKKFKNVITNPPYGGDKVNQSNTQIKNKKIKEYIKNELSTLKDELKIKTRLRQLKKIECKEKQEKIDSDKTKVSVEMCSQRIIKYAKDNKLTGNDKESSSLILLMDMVDIDGTCIGVLKEGVFFSKTYKDLRKCLVEKFNVRKVISIPQDQFENTSTKTSIIIFDNTIEKTSNVTFYNLVVEKYEEDKFEEINGEIILIESKGDICGISDKLVSEASKEELLKNPICSLNGKNYNKKIIVCGKDYELKKLGNICTFLSKSKRNASFGQEKGKYNFYTSSDKVKKCDVIDYKDECIIIGSGGVANIKIDKDFSCSADNFIIKSEYNNYIFNFLKGNMNLLIDGFIGSTLKHISKEYLENLEIPIPKSPQKIKLWIDKISNPYDKMNDSKIRIRKLENNIYDKINNITKNEKCDEVELGSICDINPDSIKKNQFSQINYIDIGSVKEGKINNIKLLTENFPSRAQRIIKKNDILFSTVRPNLKGYTFINDEIENGIATSGFAVIRSKSINPKYIYSLLTEDTVIDFLMKNSTGTSYPAVNSSIFKKIKIKIPKDKKLITKLEPLFSEIEKLQTENKDAEKLYKQYIQELSEEAIPSNKQTDSTTKIDSEESDEELKKIVEVKTIEENIVIPKKSKSRSRSKNQSNVI